MADGLELLQRHIVHRHVPLDDDLYRRRGSDASIHFQYLPGLPFVAGRDAQRGVRNLGILRGDEPRDRTHGFVLSAEFFAPLLLPFQSIHERRRRETGLYPRGQFLPP